MFAELYFVTSKFDISHLVFINSIYDIFFNQKRLFKNINSFYQNSFFNIEEKCIDRLIDRNKKYKLIYNRN